MSLLSKLTTVVVLYSLIAVTVSWQARLLAECPLAPSDHSITVQGGNSDNCGSPIWETIAYIPTYGDDDTGGYSGQGICYGGYTECNCDTAASVYITATKSFAYDLEDNGDGTWTATVWWI